MIAVDGRMEPHRQLQAERDREVVQAVMKLTIFGATGRTGRQLVEQALGAGHEVKALARDPSRLPVRHEKLTIVQGDVLDPAKVGEVMAGTDAVLSALGHTSTSTKDVQTVGTRNILAAMRKHGVSRIISLTGAGVADAEDAPKLWNKAITLLLKRLQPDVLADAEAHAEAIRASGLDWTIVRGPRLTEGPKRGSYRVGYVGKGTGATISRADLADFMLKQATDDTYVHKAPVVSY